MSNLNFNHLNLNHLNLSPDQHRLIDMYISQYNLVNSQIIRLYDMLDDIRNNIQNTIYNNRFYRNTYRSTRFPNSYLNRYIDNLINEERQNNSVFYDYNNPINPSIYSNTHQPPNNRNQSTNRNHSTNRSQTNNPSQTNNRSPTNNRSQTNNLFRNNQGEISTFLSNFLNTNVIVSPTNEQINNSSRIIRYDEIENPLSDVCPISLEHFNNDDMVRQILHCGHIFGQNSFQTWFTRNVRCPVCRYDIRNFTNNQNINSSFNNTEESNTPTNNTSSNNIPTNNIPTNNRTPFSNVNIIRNPETNQIDQIAFDITNNLLSNELLNNITSRMFENILQQNHENDRLIFDPSLNILLYETIIRNDSIRNNDNDSDSENDYTNNIV